MHWSLNDGISNWWLSSAVLCRAALRRTQVVYKCNASVYSFVWWLQSCPESSCLVLGVGPPAWLLWLWALQWVFVIHLEWIWSLTHITPSRNHIDIIAISIFISRPTSPVSLTTAKQYIGAYVDLHKKIRIKSGYPDLAWKISRKSGFANVEWICKHYSQPYYCVHTAHSAQLSTQWSSRK